MNENDLLQVIKSSETFGYLPEEKVQALFALMQIVELNTGEILFKQNTESDALYLLARGKLSAILIDPTGNEKIIGLVKSGQTVGETGFLSTQVRAMTIKAIKPSILLKLTKEAFEKFLHEPKLLLQFISTIAERSQNTISSLIGTTKHQHILLLPSHFDLDIQPFINLLIPEIAKDKTVSVFLVSELLQKSQSKILYDIINKANFFAILIYDLKEDRYIPFFLEYMDDLYLLADGRHSIQIDPLIQREIELEEFSQIKKVLLLLYEQDIEPSHTTEWLNKIHFNVYYHIKYHQQNDLQRLVRYLTNKAIGIVLSGGGFRGWVHLGVFKAIIEKNIEIDFIGGTSIGALIGALYILCPNYEKLAVLYKEGFNAIEDPFHFKNLTLPIISILNGEKGTKITEKLFGDKLIENLSKPFFCITCNLSQVKQNIHMQGVLWKWLRASMAIPGLLPPYTHLGNLHVDGGVINNFPVDVMRELLTHSSKIIGVDLEAPTHDNQRYYFPLIMKLKDTIGVKLKWANYKDYKFPDFQDFLIKSLTVGAVDRSIKNCNLVNILIKPDLAGVSSLQSKQNVDKLISIGYEAALIELEKLK